MFMSRTPNFSLNNDNNPADYFSSFDVFGNLAHFDFVVGCYVLVLLLGKLQSVPIYQNTVGFQAILLSLFTTANLWLSFNRFALAFFV